MTDAPALSLCDEPEARPIGVFDSGVGGLSILKALRERLPEVPMVYLGDVAHAPYGSRTPAWVLERSATITAWLIAQGVEIIVIACNTATVSAIEGLRARWPAHTFIGVEPAVKPAARRSVTRRIAVMSTTATANSQRLRHLIERYAGDAHVHIQACPGLAETIDRGVFDGPELLAILQPLCAQIRAQDVDTVVLGCTHYAFVAPALSALLGSSITLVDNAPAIAERAASVLEQRAPQAGGTPTLRVVSTGASGPMLQLLGGCNGLTAAHIETLAL
jgi:glutamate racemase